MGRLCLAVAVLVAASSAVFAKVEAKKGKRYLLDERHGPWMIMVISLHNRDGKHPGMKAEEVADRLIYELRKKGVPAYFFKQDSLRTRNNLQKRNGERITPPFFARHGNVCVLAGNYPSLKNPVAQRTLKYIKETFRAPFLADPKSGSVFQKTPGQPTPTAGAFLTTNPLLDEKEIAKRTRNPLVRQLNVGQEYSLLKNTGKYTMLVKTYYGKTEFRNQGKKSFLVNPANGSRGSTRGRKGAMDYGSNLDAAGYNAWRLAKELRRQGQPAFVYHDRFKSMVTLGSFNSPADPRIRQLAARFGAKTRNVGGRVVTVAHIVTKPTGKGQAIEDFVLDPSPSLMEVPK